MIKTISIYILAIVICLAVLGIMGVILYWTWRIHWTCGVLFLCLEIIALCLTIYGIIEDDRL
jgi:hypothetical protein